MRLSALAGALSLCLLASAALPSVAAWGSPQAESVLLKDIESLVLTNGRLTAGKRSQVPQLVCVGQFCDPNYQPQSVICKNMGADGSRKGNVNWKCEAELANGLKFGALDVICEGYRNSDDENVTPGSCGLEYTLLGTPQQLQQPQPQQPAYPQAPPQQTYQQPQQPHYSSQHYQQQAQAYYDHAHHKAKGVFSTLWSFGWSIARSLMRGMSWLTVIVSALVAFAALRWCTRSSSPQSRRSAASRRPGAPHSGAHAPPPYDEGQTHYSDNGKSSASSFFGRPNVRSAGVGSAGSAASGLFGQWWQTAAAAYAGYHFGSRGSRNRNREQQQPRTYQPPPQTYTVPPQQQPQYNYGNSYAAPASQPSYAPAASAPKSEVHTASGYATTKRR